MTTRRTAKKKTGHVLVNGGTTPVIYTDDGRTLAAGSRIEVESIDDTAQALIDLGYIVVADETESSDRDEQDEPGESLPKSDS